MINRHLPIMNIFKDRFSQWKMQRVEFSHMNSNLSWSQSQSIVPLSSSLKFCGNDSDEFDYPVSGRGLQELLSLTFPESLLSKDEIDTWDKDESILDVCAGQGQLIKDFRGKDFKFNNLQGFDKSEKRGEHIPYGDIRQMTSTTYQNLDRIFCTWAIFSVGGENREMKQATLRKMAAWLKPGGKIYLGPLTAAFTKDILDTGILSKLGLSAKIDFKHHKNVYCAVLTKDGLNNNNYREVLL